jgi:hypothetical protein
MFGSGGVVPPVKIRLVDSFGMAITQHIPTLGVNYYQVISVVSSTAVSTEYS